MEVEATAFNNFDDPEREASLPNGSAKVKLQFPDISYPPRPDEEEAYKEALLVTAQSALAGLAVIMKLHQQKQ
ncbi:hypothetical protein IRY61_03965 [Candidatus Saccharibacteria bacterium]|nr:hypothetical protein [Candidatus Saccharibacteria bacterium]